MSTPTVDPQAPAQEPAKPAPPAPAPEAPPAQEVDWKARYEETVAESRKWETRSKENAAAAKRLADIEEASKSEAEKAAERLAAAEARVKEYETREQIAAWKAEVAEAAGVPVRALAGSTKEEIEAHAEVLKSLITTPSSTPQGAPPVPGIAQQPEKPGNVSLADQIASAEKAGDRGLVMQLKAIQLGAVTTS